MPTATQTGIATTALDPTGMAVGFATADARDGPFACRIPRTLRAYLDVEDVLQEAALSALRGKVRGVRRSEGELLVLRRVVLRRTIAAAFRRSRGRNGERPNVVDLGSFVAAEDPRPGPAEAAVAAELASLVAGMLRSLPPKERFAAMAALGGDASSSRTEARARQRATARLKARLRTEIAARNPQGS